MKRLFAGTLALVMTCGVLFSGCGKQMTPEEEAASQEAAISQQLQDEENKTGLKRLISNNLTEYEQPVHDFIEGLQDGNAEKTATALGVPNTFGEKLQDWVVVNDFETFQKTDMTNICLNSAKEGSKAVINVFMKTPGEVTADTSPDYTLTAEYTNGAWVLNPPTGILTDYSFTVPNNKVSFQGTDLSNYTAKNAETGVWTVTLPRALDLDSDAAYVISTDMGDFNGRVYQIAADGNKKQMLLADSGNPYFLWLVHNCQACWLSTPVDVATPGSEDYDTWSYYMYSNDVKAYLITVNEKVEKVAYPKCLEVLREK